MAAVDHAGDQIRSGPPGGTDGPESFIQLCMNPKLYCSDIIVTCLGRNWYSGERSREAMCSGRERVQGGSAEGVWRIQIPCDCWCDGLCRWPGPRYPCGPLGQGE